MALAVLLGACAPMAGGSGTVIARNSEFIVVAAGPGDTLRSLAAAYLGDESRAAEIADFNGITGVEGGQEVVIPRKPTNPGAVYVDGFQTVPILAYHRFTSGDSSRNRMEVTARDFERQMAYLREHGYRVVPLSDLDAFFAGDRALPQKAVVLTIDDGYRSTYTVAYPILRKYGFPATVFLYSDFAESGGGLNWAQMKEMVASGLIDIQPHSKTHSNLALRAEGESMEDYRRRIEREIDGAAQEIRRRLGVRIHTFAYPYGDSSETVLAALEARGYGMGVTVRRGGNPVFGDRYMLRREMIYGDDSLALFGKRLKVFHGASLK